MSYPEILYQRGIARSIDPSAEDAHQSGGQWFRVFVPTAGFDSVLHLGKNNERFGYPGITLATRANLFTSAYGHAFHQTYGDTWQQTLNTHTQVSGADMSAFAAANLNLGATGGVVIAAIHAATPTVTAQNHAGTATPQPDTHATFLSKRGEVYSTIQEVNDWANEARSTLNDVKQKLGITYDGQAASAVSGALSAIADVLNTTAAAATVGTSGTNGPAGAALAIVGGFDDPVAVTQSGSEAPGARAGGTQSVRAGTPPSGIALVSDSPVFIGTTKGVSAVANGGYAFATPGTGSFNVLAGGGVELISLQQASLCAVQGLSVEGGASADLSSSGPTNVTSRARDVNIVGKTILVGAVSGDLSQVFRARDLDTSTQAPTQEITVKAIDSGTIEITTGETRKVTIGPSGIKVVFSGHSIELSAAGVAIKSSSKVSIEAPQVEIKASTSVKITSPDTKVAGKFEAAASSTTLTVDASGLTAAAGQNFKITPSGIVAG